MSKKICAVIAFVLFYVGIFMLFWEIVLRTSAGLGPICLGFPLIAACYYLIAGTLLYRHLQVKRWHLWFFMNIIGYPLCWIMLIIKTPGILMNGAILFFLIPMTIVLAVVWGIVGAGFLCVRLFKRLVR